MFQKLIEPFKNKGPKQSGDLNVTITQNSALNSNSHQNMLSVHYNGKCDYNWYRVTKQKDEPIQNRGHQYMFQLNDVGSLIKVIVRNGDQSATIMVGPIVLDKSIQMAMVSILNQNGSKFPITIESCRVAQDDRVTGELKNVSMISNLQISGDLLRLSVETKDAYCTIKYTMKSPIIALNEDKIILQFTDIDQSNHEELSKFLRKLSGIQLLGSNNVQIIFTPSSQKQRDLIILSFKVLGAKQIVMNHKLIQSLDKICVGEFDEQTFQGPADLLMTIANQQIAIESLGGRLTQMEREKHHINNKIVDMEQEMETTIAAYQQILQEHNLTAQYSSLNKSFNKSIKATSLQNKQMEILQQENRDLKDKLSNINQSLHVEQSINAGILTKDQLIKKVNELDLNYQKSRRLNDILNRELKQLETQNSDQLQLQEYKDRITELEYQNQLVQEYHHQIIEQQNTITQLNKKIQSQQSNRNQEKYIYKLQQQIEELRLESEKNDSVDQSQYSEIQSESMSLVSENQRLQEHCAQLKRKNDSLLKEINQLVRNPNQMREVQGQIQNTTNTKQVQELKQQIYQQEQEIVYLKDELTNRTNKSIMTTSNMSNNHATTEMSRGSTSPVRRASSRSIHGIFDQLPPQIQLQTSKYLIPRHKQNMFSVN